MITTTAILWIASLLAAITAIAANIARLVDRKRQRLAPTRHEYTGCADPVDNLPKRAAPILAGRKMDRVARWSDIAQLIQTGDLISFSGRTLFAYVIRAFTYSDKSHVGVAVVDDEGIWIVDSCEGLGVTKRLLHDDVRAYPGQYYWHQASKEFRYRYKREKIAASAMQAVGANVQYGWAGIILQFILHCPVLRTFAYLLGFASCSRFTKRPFCSMAATNWIRTSSVDPVPGRDSQLIVPQELCQSMLFPEGVAILP